MKRNEFRSFISKFFTVEEEVNFIMAAYDYSKYAHRNQERELPEEGLILTEKRYFNHPKRLVMNSIEAGVRDWQTICIELLHDSVEDTGIFGNQVVDGYEKAMEDARFRINNAFNKIIAEDVIALTIPNVDPNVEIFSTKTKCLAFYKNKLRHASVRALLAKEFDRLDNLQSIEVKGEKTALLKIKETEGFYIPLFTSKFVSKKSDLEAIGYANIDLLQELVERKKKILEKGVFLGKDNKPIVAGSNVSFIVENQDDWGGDNEGVLIKENGEFKIKTENSGILTIGKGYDAYPGTIKKIS